VSEGRRKGGREGGREGGRDRYAIKLVRDVHHALFLCLIEIGK